MDSYPKELIEGVSPLIFAVDAVLNNQQSSPLNHDARSSIFESFYNSIASKESINATSINSDSPLKSSSTRSIDSSPARHRYFRFSRGSAAESSARKKSSLQSSKKDFFSNAHIVPVSNRHAFPPSKDPFGNSNQNINLNIKLFKSISSSSVLKRSTTTATKSKNANDYYALSSLKHRSVYNILKLNPIQGILPSGWIEKHVHALPSTLLFVTELSLNPINDSGSTNKAQQRMYDQALLEQHLLNTMENITSSIAKKRDVPIHLVILVRMEKESDLKYNEQSMNQNLGDLVIILQERIQSIKTVLRLNSNAVTTLPYFIDTTEISSDVKDETDNVTNSASKHNMKYNTTQLSKLQQTIYENSNLYYLTQVRRFKRKYALLHHDKIYDLLPFAIRYCVKIAIFYEFQCSSLDNAEEGEASSKPFMEEEEEKVKLDKSIKYWKEAYRNIIEYYQFLIEKEMQLRAKDENFNLGQGAIANLNSSSRRLQERVTALADTDDENDDETLTPSKNQIGGGESVDSNQEEAANLNQDNSTPPPPPPADSTPIQTGIEVALAYSPKSGQGGVTIGAKTPIKPPDASNGDGNNGDNMTSRTHSEDMIHQCRAVADWINFKLLLVMSNAIVVTNDSSKAWPINNLGHQIRKHAQVFLSKPVTLTRDLNAIGKRSSEISHLNDPTWYFWQFVAHQKQVLAEFMEQCTKIPTNIVLESLSHDVSCQFSAAKHFMSSGEALLMLGNSIQQNGKLLTNENDNVEGSKIDSSAVDNRQRFVGSLAMLELRSVFEEESGRDHSDLALDAFKLASTKMDGVMKQTNISSARLNQLIGGIYLRQEKFEDAIKYLETALSCSKVFPSMQLMLEKALIHCYKNVLCLEVDTDYKEKSKSKLTLSVLDLVLKTGLGKMLSTTALSGLLQDSFEILNNENKDDIFIEWPDCDDGDQPIEFSFTFPDQTYAIEGDVVKATLHLRSNLSTPIVLQDLSVLSSFSTNLVKIELENECSGWVLIPGEIKRISAKVTLQSYLSKSVDTKLVELQSLRGEKVKTAGLTSLGGGIYSDHKNRKQFSKGGLCVGCTALNLKISLTGFESSSSCITIKISNSHRGTSSLYRLNTKRSITEEDNYIFSAWSRPTVLPLSHGPRCLRVVCAQPDLEIIDCTTDRTNGKLMEGTVNRILLKLSAGPTEHCRNVKFSIVCSSIIEGEPASSPSLLDKEASTEKKISRKPVLVEQCDDSHANAQVPFGWTMNSKNYGQGARDDWIDVQDTLVGGSSTFAFFDLFRALPEYETHSNETCRTNFLVTVSYNQVRSIQCEASRDGDLVVQEYRGSAIWCSPMKANISFADTSKKTIPCGIRHRGNLVSKGDNVIVGQDSIALRSGSIACMKCSVEALEPSNHLVVSLKAAKFETGDHAQQDLNVDLITSNGNDDNNRSNLLYSPGEGSFCQNLDDGVKLNIAFATRPSIPQHSKKEFVSGRLGSICFDWLPIPFQKSDDDLISQQHGEFHNLHGPLPVKKLQSLRYPCPSCHIENTPFDASFQTLPCIPRVGHPFEVIYLLRNQTTLHQRLRVMMNDSDSTIPSNSMLISGVINGEIILGPLEEKTLSYSLLVTKVGETTIPSLDVSSIRYNTWIIHGTNMSKIYIAP